jgi:hypothetical protein
MLGLNHVGKYCHKLEELAVIAQKILSNYPLAFKPIPDKVKNYSVKKLCISGSGLTANQLWFISAYFPCLENLTFDNFFNDDQEKTTSTIHLDNSILKYIKIKIEEGVAVFPGLSGIHVNVTTDTGLNRYVFLSTEREVLTDEE